MFVMFYEPAPDFLPKARLHFPAHRARLEEFHGRGVLLGAGPLEDPFVVNGVTGRWRIRKWADACSS